MVRAADSDDAAKLTIATQLCSSTILRALCLCILIQAQSLEPKLRNSAGQLDINCRPTHKVPRLLIHSDQQTHYKMPSSQDSVLAVIGSGPGIGSATASLFAQNGFNKVALISRNADRLKEDSQAVEQAAEKTQKHVSVRTWAVDITDTGAYGKVLDELASFGTLECVFFNAARVQPSYLMTEPIEQVEYDFKVFRATYPGTLFSKK